MKRYRIKYWGGYSEVVTVKDFDAAMERAREGAKEYGRIVSVIEVKEQPGVQDAA